MALMTVGLFLMNVPASSQDQVPLAELLPDDVADYAWFGASVAVSGNVAVVGAGGDDDVGTNAGTAYLFERDGAAWIRKAKLFALDGSEWSFLGHSVAVSGDVAVISTSPDSERNEPGAAYVFVRMGAIWTQQAKLLAADGATTDRFGHSVSVSGDVAVIGASWDDDLGAHSGAAYVFVRDGITWTQQAKLLAADGAAASQFGEAVALSGDVAVIGAPHDGECGSAYVFVRNGTSWTQQAKLTPADADHCLVQLYQFGQSVALSGEVAMIGAPFDDSAYVFARDGATWTQQAKLLAADGGRGHFFGISVAVSGDVAVVGARRDGDGSAYVFGRNGNAWTQNVKLLAADGAPGARFGSSVAVSGDVAVIGAPDDGYLTWSGEAYVFLLESDSDGDGVGDSQDAFPDDPTEWLDSDGDGAGNDSDSDDDNDGVTDAQDALPTDPTEWLDSDADGVGDNADAFPDDSTEWLDSDGDGVGDNADEFPYVPTEWVDTDGDGIGDTVDPDDDNDGVPDEQDAYPLGQFADAPPGSFAFSFIEALGRSGIDAGCGGDNFCPSASVSRAEIAVLLELALNGSAYTPPAATGNVFLDVDAETFAAAFIEQLFHDGITAGCGNGNYCPSSRVTRAQIAVLLLRAEHGADYTPPPPIGRFTDVGPGYWASAWIEQLAAEGITVGCGGGNYCPDAPMTRAQMAVFFVRAFDL